MQLQKGRVGGKQEGPRRRAVVPWAPRAVWGGFLLLGTETMAPLGASMKTLSPPAAPWPLSTLKQLWQLPITIPRLLFEEAVPETPSLRVPQANAAASPTKNSFPELVKHLKCWDVHAFQ